MKSASSLIAVATTCLLTACATPEGRGSAMSLAGTEWQLLSIQSMEDAQGTTRIPHPERFTVRFGADGEDAFTSACEFQSDGSRSRCDLKFTHKEIIA